jgi:GAF domain-containing protein
MRRWLRRILGPTSAIPAIAQKQVVLNAVLISLMIPLLIVGIGGLVMAVLDLLSFVPSIVGLIGLIIFILAYFLGRRGYVGLAGIIPSLTICLIAIAASIFQVGLGQVSLIGFAITVTIAGSLIGYLAAIAFALIGVLTFVMTAWAQINALLPPPLIMETSAIVITTGTAIGLFMLVLLNWLSNREMLRALDVERSISDQLQTQSRELEEMVAVRTRGLVRRAVQLQTTADIAKLATEMAEPESIMSQSVELIRERFGFYHASIFLMDDTGNWANLVASTGEAGQKMIARRHRLAVGSASIIGWVTSNRLPRVALNVDQDPFYFRNPLLPDTNAEMAVPLLVGQRLIGALDIQSTDAEAFDEDDVRALEGIASELAVAIDRARVQRDMQDRLDRMQQSAMFEIREAWARVGRSGATPTIHLSPQGDFIPADEGRFQLIDKVSSEGRTIVSADGSEIGVPIQVRGELIATLSAKHPQPSETWTEDDIALIEAIASQTALSLESARQRDEEHRRVTELEVLNRVSQAVSQMLRLDTLYRIVHRQINQVLGETDMRIALYNEPENKISIAYATIDEGKMTGKTYSLGDDPTSAVIRSRQPLLLMEDAARQAALLGVQDFSEDVKSWIGVPLLVGDEILGVLIVEDPLHENRYTEDDAALLTTIASQIAAGIQNTQLLDQVQRTARRERLIHEITSKVRRSPDMKSVLDTTTRELARALNAVRSTASLDPSLSEGGDSNLTTLQDDAELDGESL